MSAPAWIGADWAAPPGVHALTTTRAGGVSLPPYDSLNLAAHVGDDPAAVARNRARLRAAAALPGEPQWLDQVHGVHVVEIGAGAQVSPPQADAAWTRTPGEVVAVLTADCLPVAIAARSGRAVAVAHAGWRGLLDGVLEVTAGAMREAGEGELVAWLGPAIGPQSFEVGPEVRAAFLAADPAATAAFRSGTGDRWFADLYVLARRRLARLGIARVSGGGACTYTDPRYYSYRRDRVTGRMATLAWIDPPGS